jgi:hypothetical protein
MNYFAIERNGECKTPVILVDKNGDQVFAEFLEMNYDEMKSSELLEEFVATAMEASDSICSAEEAQAIITLIDEDDIFIWSIIMSYDDENIRYVLLDWKKDGKNYRYTP